MGFRHRVARRPRFHILDAPFWALKLKYPVSVEGCISTYWNDLWKPCPPKNENYPRSTIARFTFPAREGMPEVKLTWWDGGMMPPRPDELDPGRQMGDSDGGVLFVGDKGLLMCGCYGRSPELLPAAKMRAYKRPKLAIERIPGGQDGHEKDWVRACKGGKPASSNFDYSGPLSEMVLMGNLAVHIPGASYCGTARKWKSATTPRPTVTSAGSLAKGGHYRADCSCILTTPSGLSGW